MVKTMQIEKEDNEDNEQFPTGSMRREMLVVSCRWEGERADRRSDDVVSRP